MADDAAVAFGQLYARYHRRLRGLATHLYGAADAEDIAQEAMARAYASYATLDPDRDPWPWLVAIARNVARDRYARPRPVALADVPVAAPDATAGVEERLVVSAALGRLSAEDRGVLVLREWHELSFAELGRLLGRSPNALRQQVFRARRRLAAAYTDLGGRAVALAAWPRWRAPGAAQVA
ncbi:MAG TPA: sigma-70 family RNA polymerase sigma factor, partial [Frankiaceae bacterium]|nr:sigma-70 family RNA polymerase sigma factor [Frankiaceae bacterium]